MKNKILSSVLAVCLFVGMAVPAFATDWYSTVAGDATKATLIDFYKDGKVITELSVTKDAPPIDVEPLVRVFEDKNTLILDKSYLTYSLEGDSLSFGLDGTGVSAIDGKGEMNLIVKSSLNEKAVGKLKLKAVNATSKYATGFRFSATSNVVTTGANAETSEIKVSAVPAGAQFNTQQQQDIDVALKAVLEDATSHYTVAPNTAFNLGNTLTVTGLRQGETIVFKTSATGAQGSATTSKATISAGTPNALTGGTDKVITVEVIVASDAVAGTYSVGMLQSAAKKVSPSVTLKNSTGTTITTPAAHNVGNAATATQVKATIGASSLSSDLSQITYTIGSSDAIKLTDSSKKSLRVVMEMYDGNNNSTKRTITATTTLQNVYSNPAVAIAGPGTIELEVGEVYDTNGKMKYGPSYANVAKNFTLSADYYGNENNAMDYAAIEGSKILGVKVGKNKVVVALTGTDKTATIIVNVIPKGSRKPVVKPEKPVNPTKPVKPNKPNKPTNPSKPTTNPTTGVELLSQLF